MEVKTIRILISLCLALLGVFFLLLLVNFIGAPRGPKAGEPAAKEESGIAGLFYGSMKYDRSAKTPLPSGREGLSTASVRTEGAIMLVREKDFGGVADSPKSRMDALNALGGGRKGPTPVSLRDEDMAKKISAPAGPKQRLEDSVMPELGRKPGQDGVTLITAPVDYKVFKSSAVWRAFADSRKIADIPHDFAASGLLILFSVSDFPNGIFKIVGVERSVDETVVKYRVDPLAMAAEADRSGREAYASAPVPRKGPPIKLVQVP